MAAKNNKLDLALAVGIISSLIGLAFGYGVLNSKVEAHEERLKQSVQKTEFETIQKWQVRYEDSFDKRMTRFETKLDRLIEQEHK